MAKTVPNHLPFDHIVTQIERGEIQIPRFQREFVWTRTKSAALLDSIIKGYPIGTFILWQTKEQLRAVRRIGGLKLPAVPEGQFSLQVLDGQQRLTSLFASIKGETISRNGKREDFGAIGIDLRTDPESDQAVVCETRPEGAGEKDWISLSELLDFNFKKIGSYPEDLHDRMQDYRQTLKSYSFSIVTVQDATIAVATEIFTRLNVGGQKLTTFEIMVAKTYDPVREFDLAERYEKLNTDLQEVGFGALPSAVVLQTVGALQSRVIKSSDLLDLDKQGFIDTWPQAVSAIKLAVDYFRNGLRIPVAKLLPYPHFVILFAYFFSKHPGSPEGESKKLLTDFFWRVSMGTWYSRSTEARVEADLKKIDSILDGVQPKYELDVDVSPQAIANHGWFRTGRAWVKAILCLYAYKRPQSFSTGASVRISSAWLKQVNSKNYHHFFPRSWMKKNRPEDWRENHVANITIVDDYLNKKRIRARAPSDYMVEFRDKNENFQVTMATHLIRPEKDGVYDDDFDLFFRKRCKRISKELNKRIIPMVGDHQAGTPEVDEEEDQ